jgi:NAD(P)-dependent dehydrogenase (short-subunit alcohol dehydrogenase family)
LTDQNKMNLLLSNKVAAIYGAGGAIGGAVARAFGREGARVYLAGRTQAKIDNVANEIRSNGGAVETAVVDVINQLAVDAFVDAVVEQAGAIDISMNVIRYGDVQQPLMEISLEDYLQPITNPMRTQFLTTKAAARHMIPRISGVILAFGGNGPQTLLGLGGFKVALDAIEGLRRQWACELGQYGIRAVTLKTGGIPESFPANFAQKYELTAILQKETLLNRTATLADVGNVTAFIASALARTMNSTEVNISCGALID